MKSRSPWTAEKVASLCQLRAAGYSATAIARKLGPGFTKNAVCAKADRLGLPALRPPTRGVGASTRTLESRLEALAAATGHAPEDLLRRGPRLAGRRMPGFSTCRWIEAERGPCCGAPVKPNRDAWPYCAKHLKAARWSRNRNGA